MSLLDGEMARWRDGFNLSVLDQRIKLARNSVQ